MSAVKVEVPFAEFMAKTDIMRRHRAYLPSADARLQKYVAEVMMVRLFDEFQNAISGACSRLLCGASYIDGTSPALLTTPCRSTTNAFTQMRSFGRGTKSIQLKWSKASYICEALQHSLDSQDPLVVVVRANGSMIEEMRRVRTRVAHNNVDSRAKYRAVVKKHYGAKHNHVTPGVLLLTDRFATPLLDFYISTARTVLRAALKG